MGGIVRRVLRRSIVPVACTLGITFVACAPRTEPPKPAQQSQQISEQEIKTLINDLKGLNSLERGNAAMALGMSGDVRVVPALMVALNNENDEIVKQMIIEALGNIGDEMAVPALIKELEDDVRGVRLEIVYALGKIRG